MKQKAITLVEWQNRFHDELACIEHITEIRWQEGFCCPHCGGTEAWYTPGHALYDCKSCRKRTSVTSGTLFHSTKLPLTSWFVAIYFCAVDKGGISATRLQAYIDVSWNTARLMLAKIRKAMGERDQMYLLQGLIELDDALIGGKTTGGKRGRGSEKKTSILVACEHDAEHNQAGYLKMQVVENVDEKAVSQFAQESFVEKQDIRTDGSSTLKTLEKQEHRVESKVIPPQQTHKWLPWVHIAIANLKRFLLGTYHGVSGGRLQEYMDEFCYRFNRRRWVLEIPNRLLNACLLHKPILRLAF